MGREWAAQEHSLGSGVFIPRVILLCGHIAGPCGGMWILFRVSLFPRWHGGCSLLCVCVFLWGGLAPTSLVLLRLSLTNGSLDGLTPSAIPRSTVVECTVLR